MKKLIWTFACFCVFSAGAQDIDKHKKLAWQRYENFKPLMKTGEILEDAGIPIIAPRDFSGNKLKSVSFEVWLQLYQQMYFGSKDQDLKNPDSLKLSISAAIANGLQPILYLKAPFLRINPEVIDGKIVDTTVVPWKIKPGYEDLDLFERDTLTIIATPLNGIGARSSKFLIDQNFIINRCKTSLRINNLDIDVLISNPNLLNSFRLVEIKEDEVSIKYSIESILTNQLPIPSITEGVLQFEVIPNSVYDENSKQIVPNFGKQDVKGLVTVFPGRDPNGTLHTSFEKVLIFTDGIDFGVFGVSNPEFDIENPDKTVFLNYGERGASMLMKGQSLEFNGTMATRWIPLNEYNAFENCPNMIETLRNEGYDFMFLDFKDGAGFIQDNAMVLTELLSSLNNNPSSYLTGKLPFGTSNINSIYLVGPSMGGQVVRYSLDFMEKTGQNHCVDMSGLFDSPNNGANIPMSVQYAMDELSFVSFARDIRDRKLNSPAARQLLIEHYSSNGAQNHLRNDLISELSNLGNYPKLTYIAAMSNGSGTGVNQPIQPSDKMFYSQKLGAILNVEGYTNPGLPTPKGQLLFECTYLSLFKNKKFTNNQIPWETLPGGVFKGLDANSYIKFKYDNFCFIPTTSALGDTTNNWNQANRFETSFNGIFYNQNNNDVHVKVDFSGTLNPTDPTFGNADFFRYRMHELDKKPDHLNANQHFNYGNKLFASIYSSVVENGATLSFSNAAHTPGWGINPLEKIQTAGLDEYTPSNCKPNIYIHIKQGGTLEIGTPSNFNISRNAIVRITAGSVLELDGTLRIHPGSTLIIEEGAKLILNSSYEIDLIDQKSSLIIEGDFVINSSSLETSGSGKLTLSQPFQKSRTEFNGTTFVHLGKNATSQSIVFELGDHTNLSLPSSVNLKIEPATIVEMGVNAMIVTEASIHAEKVTFRGKNKSTHQGVRLLNSANGNINGAKFLNGSPGLWIETSFINHLSFKNLLFRENVTGLVSINCSPDILSSSFIGNDVAYYFENNPNNTTISKSQFKNNHYCILGIQTSNSKLSVTESNFENGFVGIDITGGICEIGCTRFSSFNSAVKGTRQEISFLPGNVEFYNNSLDVEGIELIAWDLENTGTRFSSNGDVQIEFIQGTRSLIPDANGYYISGAGNLLNRDMYSNSTKSALPRMYFFDQSFNLLRPILFSNCGVGFSQCLFAPKPGCWNNYNSEPLNISNNDESTIKSKAKIPAIPTLDSLLQLSISPIAPEKQNTLLYDIYQQYATLFLSSAFVTETEEHSYLEWIENTKDKFLSAQKFAEYDTAERLGFFLKTIEFYMQIQEPEKAQNLLSEISNRFTDVISKAQLSYWNCSLNTTNSLCFRPLNYISTKYVSSSYENLGVDIPFQIFENSSNSSESTKTEIFTSSGQLIQTRNSPYHEIQAQYSLPPGVYLVKTTAPNNTSIKKLVVR